MAIASLCLGALAFLFMVLGMIFSMVPVAGAILSLGAPVLALFGVVLGGVSISRASQMGDSTGLGTAGTAVSGVAFLVSLVFALTCGLCNACVSTALLDGANSSGSPFGPSGATFGTSGCPNPPCGASTPASPPPSSGSSPAPPPLPANFAPDASCDEVRPCCMAFTHGDPTVCDGVLDQARQQADPGASCRDLAAGWASGLEQLGEPVPNSCLRPVP